MEALCVGPAGVVEMGGAHALHVDVALSDLGLRLELSSGVIGLASAPEYAGSV